MVIDGVDISGCKYVNTLVGDKLSVALEDS